MSRVSRLAQAGKEREARRGMVVLVPATLRTGRDGIVDLRQGTTLVNVGPGTVLEFPAAQERGAPVERIVREAPPAHGLEGGFTKDGLPSVDGKDGWDRWPPGSR